jgi:DNA-binding SARP family transcriptional activator/predicted RNA-binding Zn ribbon-like protein
MDFRLLGPFEARVGGRSIPVGTRRQERLLLAALLLDADRLVPVDRLIDLLWSDDDPPRSARAAIHTYMARLRQTLTAYGVAITTRHDGYRLEADGHTIDVTRFADLAKRAGAAVDPGERVRLFEQALGLWHGPLLADLADERLRHRLGAPLLELRLTSVETWADARLAMGDHHLVLTELAGLVDEHPTRERLVGSLMTALFRAGRASDALEQYQKIRKNLVTSLGVEPGPQLQDLHRRILRNDPALDRPPAPPFAVRVRDQWLPWKAGGHAALEFCNTFAGWGGRLTSGGDWLLSYRALAVWAGYVDLADDDVVTWLLDSAERDPSAAIEILEEARRLRVHLYTCLTSPDDPASFAVVARYAEAAAKVSQFGRDRDGLGQWRLASSAGLRLPLYAAAAAGADLLADPRRYTVRRCPGVHCGWLYLDQSRLRQWCSTDICGRGAILRSDAVACAVTWTGAA